MTSTATSLLSPDTASSCSSSLPSPPPYTSSHFSTAASDTALVASSSSSLTSPFSSSSSSPVSSSSTPSSSSSHSPSSSPHALWTCPFGCGIHYSRSSGRSIRRHVVSCFRSHNPSSASLNDVDLSALIDTQHETGQLHTGLRRWRMRQPRRLAHNLSDDDRWDCVWHCGKSYRATSSRSIQRHTGDCFMRTQGGERREGSREKRDKGASRSRKGSARKRVRSSEQRSTDHAQHSGGQVDANQGDNNNQQQHHQQQQPAEYETASRRHQQLLPTPLDQLLPKTEPVSRLSSRVDEAVNATRQRLLWSAADYRGGNEQSNQHYSHYPLLLPLGDSVDECSASPSPGSPSLLPSPPPLAFLSSASFMPNDYSSQRPYSQPDQPLAQPLHPSDLKPLWDATQSQPDWSSPSSVALHLPRPLRPPSPAAAAVTATGMSSSSFFYTGSGAVSDSYATHSVAADDVGGQLRSFLISLYLRHGTRHPVFEQRVVGEAMVAEAIQAATVMQQQQHQQQHWQRSH